MIAADGNGSGEEDLSAAADHGARGGASDVDEQAGDVLIGFSAVDVAEAVDQGHGFDVHADDIEPAGGGGGEQGVDGVAGGGHEDDFEQRLLVVMNFAGDEMAHDGLGEVDGEFAACFPAEGFAQLVVLHARDAEVADEHGGGGQSEHGLAAAEISLSEQVADVFGEEGESGVGVESDVMRDIGAGGGDESRVVAVKLHLCEAQAIAAEVDADRLGVRGEPVLYFSEHMRTASHPVEELR